MRLWTTEDAANHWGVSESRARAILAKAGVDRISGFDPDAVQSIPRPGQGARTDLRESAMMTTEVNIRRTVIEILDAQEAPETLDRDAIVAELISTYDLTGERPTMTTKDIPDDEFWAVIAKHDSAH